MTFLGGYLGTDLASGIGNNLAPRCLPVSVLNYANASERYFLHGGVMTGPFAAHIPAVLNIGGYDYVQLEKSASNIIPYSLDYSSWTKANVSVVLNASVAPNSTNTATSIKPTVDNDVHAVYNSTISIVSGNYYTISFFAKADGYSWARIYGSTACFPSNFTANFDLINGVTGTVDGCTADIIYITNGWYLCKIYTPLSDATAAQHIEINPCISDGVASYPGDITKGILLWHSQLEIGTYSTSVIPTNGSSEIRAKCEAYYSEAIVPTWMRTGPITLSFIPHYSSAQIDGNKYLEHFADSVQDIDIYMDSSGQINVDGVASLLQTTAHTWSANQICKVTIIPTISGVSRVITSGFTTGNNTYDGTAYTTSDGNVYWGMDSSTANQIDGKISVPRPGYV